MKNWLKIAIIGMTIYTFSPKIVPPFWGILIVLGIAFFFLCTFPIFMSGSEKTIEKWYPKIFHKGFSDINRKFRGDFPFLFKEKFGGKKIQYPVLGFIAFIVALLFANFFVAVVSVCWFHINIDLGALIVTVLFISIFIALRKLTFKLKT